MKTEGFENREDEESSEIKEPVKDDGDSFDGRKPVSDIPPSADGDGKHKKPVFELPIPPGQTERGGRPRPTNPTPLP